MRHSFPNVLLLFLHTVLGRLSRSFDLLDFCVVLALNAFVPLFTHRAATILMIFLIRWYEWLLWHTWLS
jgi:hypothetical protein